MSEETAPGRTLREVRWEGDSDAVKDEHLWGNTHSIS